MNTELVSAIPVEPVGLPRRAELGEALARMLRCLSPAERIALVLHEGLDCDHAAIAAALRTRTTNTRQHLARVRRRLRASTDDAALDGKLCRDLVRRFQAALHGQDMPAMLTLLADEQPVPVHTAPPVACAKAPVYALRRLA